MSSPLMNSVIKNTLQSQYRRETQRRNGGTKKPTRAAQVGGNGLVKVAGAFYPGQGFAGVAAGSTVAVQNAGRIADAVYVPGGSSPIVTSFRGSPIVAGGPGGGGTYLAGDGIAISGFVVSAKPSEFVDASSGLEVISETIKFKRQSSSGLVADATGVAVLPKPSGGLLVDSGGVFIDRQTNSGLVLDSTGIAVVASSTGGLMVDSAGIRTKLRSPYSALTADIDGLRVSDSIAGNGLDILDKIVFVGAGNGITVGVNTVAVNQDFNFAWTGPHSHTSLSTFNGGATFNGGVFTFNTAPQVNANLHFAGTARTITSSSLLTLNPTGNLHLNPTANITMENLQTFRTVTADDLVTGIKGMNIFNRADFSPDYVQMTIGAIKADELHVRIFTADETRISRGEEYWSKSFGVVQEDFSIPAINSAVSVWFEDAPGAGAGISLFAANDWLLLRTIDWQLGLVTQSIWFQVVGGKLAQETLAVHGVDRQRWSLKRIAGGWTTSGASNKVKAGNVILDAGQTGQGWVHLSALASGGGPFIQFGKMTSVSTTPVHSNYVRIGNLKNAAGFTVDTWGMAAGNDLSEDRNAGGFKGFVIEGEQGLTLYNTDIFMYDGITLEASLTGSEGLQLLVDTDWHQSAARYISWHSDLAPLTEPLASVGAYSGDLNSALYLDITVENPTAAGVSNIVMLAHQDNNMGALIEVSSHDGVHDGLIRLSAELVHVSERLKVGLTPEADSTLHVREITSVVGTGAGLTIEQGGSGDALAQFLITDGQRFVMGIDQTDNKFKVAANANVGTNPLVTIDPSTGDVGIGVVTAAGKLHVADTSGGATAGFVFSGSVTSGYAINLLLDNTGAKFGHNSSVRDLQFQTASLTRFRIKGNGFVSVGDIDPVARFHVYGNTTSTGATAGQTIEQAGTGDSVLHWVRGTTVYSAGIDATDGLYKIGVGYDLGDNPFITYNPSTGITTVAGLTTGGGGGDHDAVTTSPGSGIVLAGQHISIDTGVVVTHSVLNSRRVIAGTGLLDAGNDNLDANITLSINAGTGLAFSGDQLIVNPAFVIPTTRRVIAGTGLMDAGNDELSGDITLNVIASSTGGLEVGANEIHVKLQSPYSGLTADVNGLRVSDSIAGAGLDITDKIIFVGEGNGISVGTNDVSVLVLSTGGLAVDGTGVRVKLPSLGSGLLADATGLRLNPALAGSGLLYTSTGAGVLSIVPGAGITVLLNSVEVDLATNSGLSTTAGLFVMLPSGSGLVRDATGLHLNSTVAGDGLLYTSGIIDIVLTNASLAFGASNNSIHVNLGHTWAWTGPHTHAALSTFDAGATFDAGTFRFNTAPQVNSDINFIGTPVRNITSVNNMQIMPGGDLVLDPGGSSVLPGGSIEDDLGDYNRKWRTLYATELYVETLVAQHVLATIGGRVLVSPTNILIADVSSGAGTISVKYRDPSFVPNSYVFLQTATLSTNSNGAPIAQYEVMKLGVADPVAITGGWRYGISDRNVDGSNPLPDGGVHGNTWLAGDAVVSLGKAVGSGYIDLSATATVHNHIGPTITFYARTSMDNWNDIVPTTTMGNLRGFVDYDEDEFGFAVGNDLTKAPDDALTPFKGLAADRTAGVRLFNTDLYLYNSGDLSMSLTQETGLSLQQDLTGAGTERLQIIWYEDLAAPTEVRARIQSYDYSTGNAMRIDAFAVDTSKTAQLILSANQQSPLQGASIVLYSSDFFAPTLSTVALSGDRVRLTAERTLAGNVLTFAPASTLHVYEDTATVGTGAGLTIEQDGAGDAVMQFLLTGGPRWVMGIDNETTDVFRIAANANLSTSPVFTLTSAGALTLTGALAIGGTLSTVGGGALAIGGALQAPLIYGVTAADGDIEIQGTSSATKTNSVVMLQPDNSGSVTIGSRVQLGALSTVRDQASATNYVISYGTGFISQFVLYSPRGTEAVPQPNLANDTLGYFTFQGWGSTRQSGAQIRAFAYADWGAGSSPGQLRFATVAAGSSTMTDRMVVDARGVGIGTLIPEAKLHVVGDALVEGDATFDSLLGIGITPTVKLHVHQASTTAESVRIDNPNPTTTFSSQFGQLNIVNSNNTANNFARVNFIGSTGPSASAAFAARFTSHANNYGDFTIWTRSVGGFTEKVTVLSTGEVGIGDTAPIPKLSVEDSTGAVENLWLTRSGNAPTLNMRRPGVGAAAVVASTDIANIAGSGRYNSTSFGVGAFMRFTTSETWSSGARGTEIFFGVTPNGSNTAVNAFRITQAGVLVSTGTYNSTSALAKRPMYADSNGVIVTQAGDFALSTRSEVLFETIDTPAGAIAVQLVITRPFSTTAVKGFWATLNMGGVVGTTPYAGTCRFFVQGINSGTIYYVAGPSNLNMQVTTVTRTSTNLTLRFQITGSPTSGTWTEFQCGVVADTPVQSGWTIGGGMVG